MERISKDAYFIEMAKTASLRSTCLRRCYGAVIVKNGQIVSTGYNGAAKGCPNCIDLGICFRKEHNIARGTHYEACAATGAHAELNAIIQASPEEMDGATLYLYGWERDAGKDTPVKDIDCCQMCKRSIVNAGIKDVVFPGRAVKTSDWIYFKELEPTLEGY